MALRRDPTRTCRIAPTTLQVDHAAEGGLVEMARFGYALSVNTCASMGA